MTSRPYIPGKPPQCRCGIRFANPQELRVHIALMAMDYPRVRCTQEHHDPKRQADIEYLKRWEKDNEGTQDQADD